MKKFLCALSILIASLCVKSFGQAAVTVAKTVHDTAVVLRANSKTYVSDTAVIMRTRIADSTAAAVTRALAASKVVVTDSMTANHLRLDTGSFTITLTGVTDVTTGTARYSHVGYMVTLYIPALNDTSNSTACTLTGMPAGIRPAQVQVIGIPDVMNADNHYTGEGSIATTGTITLKFKASAAVAFTSTFTNSATFKGIGEAATIVYQIQ